MARPGSPPPPPPSAPGLAFPVWVRAFPPPPIPPSPLLWHFWLLFGSIFCTIYAKKQGTRKARACLAFFDNIDCLFGAVWCLFGAIGALVGAFLAQLAHYWLLLAFFWLPFGAFYFVGIPTKPKGTLWLTFGSLLAHFGSLLAHFWLTFGKPRPPAGGGASAANVCACPWPVFRTSLPLWGHPCHSLNFKINN